jgi:hypothetical protein
MNRIHWIIALFNILINKQKNKQCYKIQVSRLVTTLNTVVWQNGQWNRTGVSSWLESMIVTTEHELRWPHSITASPHKEIITQLPV